MKSQYLVVYDWDGEIIVCTVKATEDEARSMRSHFSIYHVVPLHAVPSLEEASVEGLLSLPTELT